MNRSTELLRAIFYWLFTLVFVLAAGFYLPHVAGFAALLTVALLVPVRRWQRLVERVVRGNAKILLTIALAVFTFGIAPAGNRTTTPPDDLPSIATTTTHTTVTTTVTTVSQTYVLNTNTRKFHRSDCRFVADITDNNRQSFDRGRDALIDDGYTPCGSCQP